MSHRLAEYIILLVFSVVLALFVGTFVASLVSDLFSQITQALESVSPR